MIPYINKPFSKARLKQLVSWTLLRFGPSKTVVLVEKLKDMGYVYATRAGISLGIDDLLVPTQKASYLKRAETELRSNEDDVYRGHLTSVQYFSRVINVWTYTNEVIKNELIHDFKQNDTLNPVYMMAFSGARGNISQVRQLVGMRGLMSDPNGQIIDFAIQSNFREGLSLTEYIISCYGSRKGVVDTALKTATSGYLTRRLVDVAQHVLIAGLDCQSVKGLKLNTLNVYGRKLLDLKTRLVGRVLSHDVYDKTTLIPRNQELDESLASRLSHHTQIHVRSPLTCEFTTQICQLCYGWNLANSRLVSFGVTVGVIAAQSIGEPGTQLTMRTFHTGGVFAGNTSASQGIVRCVCVGVVDFPQPCAGLCVKTNMGQVAFLTKSPTVILVKQSMPFQKTHYISMPSHSLIFVKQGQTVYPNLVLAELSSGYLNQPVTQTIETTFSPFSGEVCFETFKSLTLLPKEALAWHQHGLLLQSELSALERASIKPIFRKFLKKKQRLNHKTVSFMQNRFWLLNLEKQRLLHACKTFLKPGDLFEKRSALFAYYHEMTQPGLTLKASQPYFYFLPVFFPFMLFKHYDPIKQQRWIKQQDQNLNGFKMKKSPKIRQFRTSYQPKPQVLAREIAWPSKSYDQPCKCLSLNPTPLHLTSKSMIQHHFYATHSRISCKKQFLAPFGIAKGPRICDAKTDQDFHARQSRQQKSEARVVNRVRKRHFSSPVRLKKVLKTFFKEAVQRKPAGLVPRRPANLVLKRVRRVSSSFSSSSKKTKKTKTTCLAFCLSTVWSPRLLRLQRGRSTSRRKYVGLVYDKELDPLIQYLPLLRPKPRDILPLAHGKQAFSELRITQATLAINRLPKNASVSGKRNFKEDQMDKPETYEFKSYIQASKELKFERFFLGFSRGFGKTRWRLKRKQVTLKSQAQPFNGYFTLPSRLHIDLNARLNQVKEENKVKHETKIKRKKTYHKSGPRSVNQVKKHDHGLRVIAPVSKKKKRAVSVSASVFREKQQGFKETRGFVWANQPLSLDFIKPLFSKTEQNGHNNRSKANVMKGPNPVSLAISSLKLKPLKKPLFSARNHAITKQKAGLFFVENAPNQRQVSYVTLFANLIFKQGPSTISGLADTGQKKQSNRLNAPLNSINVLNLKHYKQPTLCLLLPFRSRKKTPAFRQRFSTERNTLRGNFLNKWPSFVVFEQGKKQEQSLLTFMNQNRHLTTFHVYRKLRVGLKHTKVEHTSSSSLKTKTKPSLWVFLGNPTAYRTKGTKLKSAGLAHLIDQRRQRSQPHVSLLLSGSLWCHNWRNYGMVFFKTCAKFNQLLKREQSINRSQTGFKTTFNPSLKTCALYYGTIISLDFRAFSEEKPYVRDYLQAKLTHGYTSLRTVTQKQKQDPETIRQHDHFKPYQKTYDHTLTFYHAFFRFLYFQVHKLPVLPQGRGQQRSAALSTQKTHSHPWPRYQPNLNLNQNQTLNSLNSGAQDHWHFVKKLNHFHVFLDSAQYYLQSPSVSSLRDKQNAETQALTSWVSVQTQKPVKKVLKKVSEFQVSPSSKKKKTSSSSLKKKDKKKKKTSLTRLKKAKRLRIVNSIRFTRFQKLRRKGDTWLKQNKLSQRFLRPFALKNAKTQGWDPDLSKGLAYARKTNQAKTKSVGNSTLKRAIDNQEHVLKELNLVNLRLRNQRLKWFLHELQCQRTRDLALKHVLCFKPTSISQSLEADPVWFKYCNNYLKFKSVKVVLKRRLLQTGYALSYGKPGLKARDFHCWANMVKKTGKSSLRLSSGFFALLLNMMATATLDLRLDLSSFAFHNHQTYDALIANRDKTKRVNYGLLKKAKNKHTSTVAQFDAWKPELYLEGPCDHMQGDKQDPIALATEHVESFVQHHTCFPKRYNQDGRVLAYASNFTLKTKAADLAIARGELIASVPNLKQLDAITQQSSQHITLNVSDQPVTEIYFVNQKNLMNYRLPFKNVHINGSVVLGNYVHASQRATQHHRFPRSGQVVFLGKDNVLLRRANRFLMPAQTKSQLKAFNFVDQHSPLLTLRYKSLTTGDIVQGIPKIERIFEGRNMGQQLALPRLVTQLFNSYRFELVNDAHYRDRIFFDVLQEVQRFTVDAVQNVYQSQGVNIADKHLEIIIKQMTTRVVISHPGETGLLFGELVYLSWVEFLNRLPIKTALFVPRVHGITQSALKGRGFLAPASFQETVRVLGQAAMLQKRDFLKGLKGNVILGYKIPMGTGSPHNPQGSSGDHLLNLIDEDPNGLSKLSLSNTTLAQEKRPKKAFEESLTPKPHTPVRFGDVWLGNYDQT